MSALADLEPKAAARQPFNRREAERVLACADLVSVGVLAERSRLALHGDRVTWGAVACATPASSAPLGSAGELRLVGRPESADDARVRVRRAAEHRGAAVLTGFSASDLLALCEGDVGALADLAAGLESEGLASIAEVPLDAFESTDHLVRAVRAVVRGGLGAWRATIDQATPGQRLDLIGRAVEAHRETGAFRALAPLPRADPADTPATGYEDVKTIAVARLMAVDIPAIQVDWPLYGPKLAQVAIAYGADDIDGIDPVSDAGSGPRRTPRAEIERQIQAAFATPIERDGRFELRG